jgi:membrane-bound serine protease (ClpP class)
MPPRTPAPVPCARRRRWPARLVALVIVALGLWSATAPAVWAVTSQGAEPGTVLVTTLAEPITPVIADHLRSGIRQAERDGHQAYIIELDTPGGLDTSMRDIVQSILSAAVPVVVYTSPPGGRSASAGAVISTSAHVAAMAPGTSIGAATPVSIDGGEINDKIVEDAAAYVEELARVRDRNTEFAIEMVRDGRAVTADRALEIGAIDLIAPNRADLLDQLDGREVVLADGRTVVVALTGEVVEHDLTLARRILQWLADPNVAFILLSAGTLGIIYELASPGVGVGGTLGITAIVLAFFSLAVLPVNAVGVIFLLLAMALFVAELFAPGVGIAAAGGVFMLVLAALFLFDEQAPGVELDLLTVIPVTLVMLVAVIFAGRLAWRTRETPPMTAGEFVDQHGEVRMSGGRAQVYVNGAWWTVRPISGELRPGDKVRVVDRQDLELLVEPIGDSVSTTEREEP